MSEVDDKGYQRAQTSLNAFEKREDDAGVDILAEHGHDRRLQQSALDDPHRVARLHLGGEPRPALETILAPGAPDAAVSLTRIWDRVPVERHRLVYDALADEMKSGVHALTITSRTPAEWQKNASSPASPPCLGGSKAG